MARQQARAVEVCFTEPQQWVWDQLNSRPGKAITICMPWGRGSGKSWLERTIGIWLLVAKYRGQKRPNALNGQTGIRIIALCPTLKQYRDIHGQALEDECYGQWKFLGGKLNRSTLRISFPDGSWFQPMPAASATSKTGRGMRCDVVLPDECDDIHPDVFDSVIRPWFSEPWSLKITLAGGTPRYGRHGLLYKLHKAGVSNDPLDDRYKSRICTYKDSPELVDAEEVEDARRNMLPGTFAREWECDFDSLEGIVYPFDETLHVRDPPEGIEFSRVVLGVDHGTEHAGVFVVVGIFGYGEDAIAWVLDEEYASHRSNHEWDSIARTKYAGLRAWADPSRPDRIDDLRCAGLDIRKADNSVQAGIGRVGGLMVPRVDENGNKSCRFHISPKCVNGIRELKTYKRKADPRNPGKFLDEVVKENDDFCDGLRYAIFSEFGPYSYSGRHETPGA